ncbi:MAG: hypothetical protein V3T72_18735 [Thermoanaerobaculia bacterium]
MSASSWFLAGLFLLGAAAGAADKPHPFVVGEPVPELLLPSAEDGRPRLLAEFLGSKLVLHVFASW